MSTSFLIRLEKRKEKEFAPLKEQRLGAFSSSYHLLYSFQAKMATAQTAGYNNNNNHNHHHVHVW